MHHKRKLGICFLIVLSILICVPKLDALVHPTRYIKSSSDTLPCTIAYLDGKEARQKVVHIPRGSEVRVRQKEPVQHRFLIMTKTLRLPMKIW